MVVDTTRDVTDINITGPVDDAGAAPGTGVPPAGAAAADWTRAAMANRRPAVAARVVPRKGLRLAIGTVIFT